MVGQLNEQSSLVNVKLNVNVKSDCQSLPAIIAKYGFIIREFTLSILGVSMNKIAL